MIKQHPNYGKGVKLDLGLAVGDTFAVALANDEFGICRVINTSSNRSAKFQGFLGFDAPLVTACHVTFKHQPSIAEVDPSSNLYIANLAGQLASSDPKRHLIKIYVHDKPPPAFIFLGNIPPTRLETELPALNIGYWHELINQWQRQRY